MELTKSIGKYPLWGWILLLSLLFFTVSCTRELEGRDPFSDSKQVLTVQVAQSQFACDVIQTMTRSSDAASDPHYYQKRFMWNLGTITPDWAAAISTRTDRLENIEVPIQTTYRYRVLQSEGNQRVHRRVKCYHKLLIVRDKTNGGMRSFIVFYVGTNDYMKHHKGILSNRFKNDGDMKTFSGLKIYTDLEGRLVRVNKYEEGCKVRGVYLANITTCHEYNQKMWVVLGMMKHWVLQKGTCRSSALTRSSSEDDDWWDYDDYWDIGNGFYSDDNGNILYDYDEDGTPDGAWIPSVDITPEDNNDDNTGEWPTDPEPDSEPEPDPDDSEEGDMENDDTSSGGGSSSSANFPPIRDTINPHAHIAVEKMMLRMDFKKMKGKFTFQQGTPTLLIETAKIYLSRLYFSDDPVVFFVSDNMTEIQARLAIGHEFFHMKIWEITREYGSLSELAQRYPELAKYLDKETYQMEPHYSDANVREHEYIADYYLDEYEAVLRELYPNQEEEFYEYGKWGALTRTKAFKTNPRKDKSKIKRYLSKNKLPK